MKNLINNIKFGFNHVMDKEAQYFAVHFLLQTLCCVFAVAASLFQKGIGFYFFFGLAVIIMLMMSNKYSELMVNKE